MFKRSILSITRKKSKTLILLIVMFVIANLVLATISIKNATNEGIEYAKKTIGGEIYLSSDMEKIRKSNTTTQEENSEPGEPGQFVKMERPKVYINDVKTIGEINYVKDYSYSISTNSNTSGFEAVESENTNFKGNGFGNMKDFMKNMGDISIEGINSYAYISEVKDKTMTLTSGTYFDEETNDKVIISYDLAQLNSLNVGDKISLEKLDDESVVELEIIGIYDISSDDNNDNRSFINSSNKIYMNVETAAKFLSSEDYNEGNYSVNNVTYYLNNPEDSDKFIESANKKVTTLEENNLKLDINTNAYETMVGPIESVGEFANIVLIVVIIAAIVIISLIINNSIKERKYEMGVLLSLGETKKNIIGQIILELIIVASVSFILSLGTSTFIAKGLSTNLLNNQIKMSKEESNNNFGRPTNMDKIRIPGQSNNNKNSNVEVIDEINVNANVKDCLILFGIGYLIICISMIIPTINIVKYEPKTILTRRD